MKKKFLLLIFFISLVSRAQLSIDNTTQTPSQLVVSSLVGAGVTPLNIKFNGTALNANTINNQVGQFSTGANATNLGIDKGLILSTGSADNAIGPNNDDAATSSPTTPFVGDPDLAKLTTKTVENVAILEFDFVATGPFLRFDYVFASEEYPEFVDGGYNDTFGFFLSGPGISGTYSNNAINIAVIPGTNIPITIDNVNNGPNNNGTCTNCIYYYNNTSIGVNPTTWGTNPTTQFDGYTKDLYASADLICGQTYHIKLAIGNVNDSGYDSAVFLKNFTIPPMILTDLQDNTTVDQCAGSVTIKSGMSATGNTFVWSLNGVIQPALTTPIVTVTQPGIYELKVYNSTGCMFAHDDIPVTFLPVKTIDPKDVYLCTTGSGPYTFNINQINYMLNGLVSADYDFTFYVDNSGSLGTQIPNADLNTYTPANQTFPQTIWVISKEIKTTCTKKSSFKIDTVPAPKGTFSYPNNSYCNTTLTPQIPNTTGLTTGGTFSVLPNVGLNVNSTTGVFIPNGSTAGTYNITYTIPASQNCPVFTTPIVTVIINDLPNTPTITSNLPTCGADGNNIINNYNSSYTYTFTPTGPSVGTGGGITGMTSGTNYTVIASSGNCTSSPSVTFNYLPMIITPQTPNITSTPAKCGTDGTSKINNYDASNNYVFTPTGPIVGASGIVTGMVFGTTYTVKATKANCSSSDSVSFSNTAMFITPPTPTVVTTPASCTNESTNIITNYDSTYTYTFNPSGPTIEATGKILGMIAGTSYTIAASTPTCNSNVSSSFIHTNMYVTPNTPIITTDAATCSDDGTSKITNYDATYTYTFTPPGPTVGTGGVISGMIIGIDYTVKAVNGICSSASSNTFKNDPKLITIQPSITGGHICVDQLGNVLEDVILDTGLSTTNYSFEWYIYNGTTPTLISGQTNSSYTVTGAGTYGVSITNLANGCKSNIVTAIVTSSSPPEFLSVATPEYFTNPLNISVTVTPPGNYEYQIDNGNFQYSNVFTNLLPGEHHVTAKNECGQTTEIIILVDYPHYFTPNGDGYHDTWNIPFLNSQTNSKIHIFDRFGKLIKIISPSGAGWDGIYLNQPLPSTDYWFVVYYEEKDQQKVFKSHFALKR